VHAVLEGHDVLAVMPTGSDKSLGFQLPALLLPGTTLVVSPLIALMKE
jgi:ATP-dependent DNA helicase RecQ